MMSVRVNCFLAILMCAVGPTLAQEVMGVEEIQPGMRGVGRSVFKGNSIEEFDVEILGVLRNALGPKQDLILARLHGDRVEYTGVVAGMSGSPVYLDGRLIGAVAYRIGSFGKEAIAGITPIQDMLKLQEIEGRSGREKGLLDGMLRVVETGEPGGEESPGAGGDLSLRGATAGGGIEPIRTPLVFSGFAPEVLEAVSPFFEERGFQPVLGGGTSSDFPGDGEESLVAGAPVAGQLVRGDIGIAATGTVTYRDGNRVLAFGHSFLRMGPVEIPMATARILHTFPSALGSFKIAAPGEVVGQFRQDRLTAILGIIGDPPRMMPVDLTVQGRESSRSFHFDIFQNKLWTPGLLFLTLGNGLFGTVDFSSESTIQMTARVEFQGHPDLEIQNVYTSLGGGLPLPFVVSLDVARSFALLYGNLFEEPVVKGIQVEVGTAEEARFAIVSGLRTPKVELEPGEDFSVDVFLVPYRGEPSRETVHLEIPENTPRGPLVLLAGSHRSLASAEGSLLQRRLSRASSLDQLIRVLSEERRNDHLYLKLYRKVQGALVQSELLTDLPPSVLSIFRSKQVSQTQLNLPIAAVQEVSIPTGWILVGAQKLDLKVK